MIESTNFAYCIYYTNFVCFVSVRVAVRVGTARQTWRPPASFGLS